LSGAGGAPLRVRYRLTPGPGVDPATRAGQLAREQTVECPEGLAPEAEARASAVVEEVVERDGGYDVTLALPLETTGRELLQLVNVLWGNASLQSDVRLDGVEWPGELLGHFAGPAFGVEGIRRLCAAAPGRPLLAAALKPLGSTPRELARRAAEAALGGVDLIKDDHGLADQSWAPFRERVLTVAEHVARANRAGGGATLYAPNLTGPVDRLAERLETLAEAGLRAALVAPLLLGLDAVRALAASSGLALVAHPAFAGSLVTGPGTGPDRAPGALPVGVLFGDLFRLAGADAVVFPHAGGRFPFALAECLALERHLAAPLGDLRRALPVLAGGIDAAALERVVPLYGADVVYLIGGSLFARPDVRGAAAELARLVRRVPPRGSA
jgi:S-methyl-5-thioribulose 1-phosphate isomerase